MTIAQSVGKRAGAAVVVYANDPLCGWCFAIGPSLAAARAEVGDEVAWRWTSGGLVTGERVRPIALDREYLLAGLEQVARSSGRRAGSGYLERVLEPGTWVSDSEPACRAVLVVDGMAPEKAIDFAHGLSDALYLEGMVPDDPATIARVADAISLDGDAVVAAWSRPAAKLATAERFAEARARGITTYPSIFVDEGDHLRLLLSGFATAETIVEAIRTFSR